MTEPEYRFLDDALRVPEAGRSELQRRALLAVNLLSQARLSFIPELALLNSVVALEVLLGEDEHNSKKFRLARRASRMPVPRDPL